MTDREAYIKDGMDKISKIVKLSLEQFNIVENVLYDLYDGAYEDCERENDLEKF